MTAPTTVRYTDRKTHDCGCITVWDTTGGGPRYLRACGVHRGYAHRFQADDSAIEEVTHGDCQGTRQNP